MRWRGEFTFDGLLVVDCETCNGTGLYPVMYDGTVIDRDHCGACGGTGCDFWDPAPLLQSLVTAAALANAFRLGRESEGILGRESEGLIDIYPWFPNTRGVPSP